MAIDFQRQRFLFPQMAGGPQIKELPYAFPANVLKAEAVISGSFFEFVGDDHPLYQLEADARVKGIIGNVVEVEVVFGIRDHTGTWDDLYDGLVDVTVIADLGSPQ